MKLPVACLALLLPLCLPPNASAAQFKIGAHQFTVPDGFVIERVATMELAPRPVSASYDDKGRLYVTDSSGSNDKPSEQLKNPTHRLLRLEDTDGDGTFDKSVVFADKVMFPQGCLWHDGSVYVAAPPSIWKFTDTDGDGVADKREEWFKGGTLTGCANDIHGPHLGPEGYIYWTKGAFDEQTHPLGNGRILKDRAAHIFRAKPDGTDLDVVMSGGMDNPVEVAFTAEGEAVFTSTFIDFTQPGRRDGIGHAVYGGVFGKVNSVLDDGRVKRTGPELMHPFVQVGAGAPSGLCRYEGSAFGAEYRDNLFASLFNLHKITRHALRLSGATYASTDSDFVVSDNLDFHPTDVLPDADGSLIIVDTGGWYKLCCPSSQLAKADVLGGIYRVRREGAKPLAKSETAAAYARLVGPPGLRDFSTEAPLKRAALRGEPASTGWFTGILAKHAELAAKNASSARQVSIAAEGLARIGDKVAVPPLFNALIASGGADEILNHSLIYAVIQIGNASATQPFLRSENVAARRAALIALDQIEGGGLKADDVTPLLASKDDALRQAAMWIVGRHPEWSSSLAGFFRSRLAVKNLSAAERDELARQLAQHARSTAIQDVLTSALSDATLAKEMRLVALRAMAQAGLKETPASWLNAVAAALSAEQGESVKQVVGTARALSMPKEGHAGMATALMNVARDAKAPVETRLEAMASVPRGVTSLDAGLFEFVLSNLDVAKPVSTRGAAATVLAKATLATDQLLALADALKSIGPLEMPKLLAVFEKSKDEALGLRVVAALKQSKTSGLRADLIKSMLAGYPATVQTEGEELLNRLNADAGKQKAHLESLLGEVHGKGDVRRGQAIFNSAKAACAACHAIGYQGGNVGPDLTRISEVRSERDLLEAIVFPSASFVRSYEPMIVAMKDGEEHSGVLRREDSGEVLLATGPTSELRIARDDISEVRPGTVSVMPQGLDEQLSRQELADLIAFLRNTKWSAQ